MDRATAGRFQVTTDGFKAYQDAIVHSLGAKHIDFAQLVKVYATAREREQRYSPTEFAETIKHRYLVSLTRKRLARVT